MKAGARQDPRAGYSLPRACYTDPAIFERDLERMLLRHWFCAGHVSSLANRGDYFLVNLGSESVIVCRGADGDVHALLNVCHHRGSRVCVARSSSAIGGGFTGRYHAWSYGLDGRLRVARRASFEIHANCKLAVENYMECYHCQPSHQEFARRHAYARPATQRAELERAARERSAALGICIADVDGYGLNAGHVTASPDAKPVAPLMGAFPEHDGSSTYFDIGPVSNFLAYADHGLIYRFIPRSVDRTDMEVIWLVHKYAVEGRDDQLERLTWLWQVTSVEDKQIIERNQEGVNSRYYEPGRYSLQEEYASRYRSHVIVAAAQSSAASAGNPG